VACCYKDATLSPPNSFQPPSPYFKKKKNDKTKQQQSTLPRHPSIRNSNPIFKSFPTMQIQAKTIFNTQSFFSAESALPTATKPTTDTERIPQRGS
jgi:hypothetical protein